MQFLPIVERELRVAARQPKTWRRWVLTMGVALALFAFILLLSGQWRSLTLGLMILAEAIGIRGRGLPWLFVLCPIYILHSCLGGMFTAPQWGS